MRNKGLILMLSLFFTASSHAVTIERPLANTEHEKVAQAIFHELKCVVCEGQSLADSDAPLALQMRAHVRQLVSHGNSHQQVLAFFRERYGEGILMTPPLEGRTTLLWIAPLLFLVIGALLIRRHTRNFNGNKP